MSDQDLQNLLESSPAICFILTSAFDGDMDHKEVSVFETAVSKLQSHANPLVRDVFQAASRRLRIDCERIVKELSSNEMMLLPSRLMICRSYAMERFPDLAPEFFQVLYDMSFDIASAAGGALGLGNKINRSEQAALGLISAALRLDELSDASIAENDLDVDSNPA